MRIGILADTHNEFQRTEQAVLKLRNAGAELLVHCGDLCNATIVQICSDFLPFYFVFGNHDADMVVELRNAALLFEANCMGWSGEFSVMGIRLGVAHGHLRMDLKPILDSKPDYVLTGHTHEAHDFHVGKTRRINPGALNRADRFTVAVLDLTADKLNILDIE